MTNRIGQAGVGFFNNAGVVGLSLGGVSQYTWDDGAFFSNQTNGGAILNQTPASNVPGHTFSEDRTTGLGTAGPSKLSHIVGGAEGYRMDGTTATIKHSFKGEMVIGEPTGTVPNGTLEVVGPQAGTVGGFAAGELQIRSSSTSAFAGAVITGHNSSGLGNKQVWYFGSISSSNANIALINRETSGTLELWTQNTKRLTIGNTGGIGFFGGNPVAKPTGVAVTVADIHAALVTLNLITA